MWHVFESCFDTERDFVLNCKITAHFELDNRLEAFFESVDRSCIPFIPFIYIFYYQKHYYSCILNAIFICNKAVNSL